MPRSARLDIPGALHHVILRGNARSPLFIDFHDRRAFLDRLKKVVTESRSAVYAWVLMENHVHLLFRSGPGGISAAMRKLLTWYAQYFNRRHDRAGHLFENRYKSVLCDEESYLLTLVRYIHLNPVRAGVIPTLHALDTYPWSGHAVLAGKKESPWMDADYVLASFGKKQPPARKAYHRFIAEGMTVTNEVTLSGGGLIRSLGGWSNVVSLRKRGKKRQPSDERILGSGGFVRETLNKAEKRRLRQRKLAGSTSTIADLIKEECARARISLKELQSGSRRTTVTRVRARIAFRAHDKLGLSFAQIARHVGVSTSAITRAVAKEEKTK